MFGSGQHSRRRNIRVEPEAGRPIRLDVIGENFLDTLYAENIGLTGILVRVPHEFEGCRLDKTVRVQVLLPEPISVRFECAANVQHVSGRSFGIRFVALDGDAERHIREYLQHRLNKPGGIKANLFRWGVLR